MKLSIIIVNYNVKYFLEQCLYSVREAVKSIDAEIYVVDNNSVDGSCTMIKEKFTEVQLIENKKNTGFSVANNQAIRQSKGEYVVLLNPDTLVEANSFLKVIDFMDKTPDSGGVGVKMIDGNGNFLPESKRGLPTPMVAFYKIFGISKLFPKSKTFGRYHLGYLDNEQIHEVEVLSGACMFLRRKTLDKIGLLDETFFMYGEDIDLSYRVILGGYKNYYFPDTTIIHYKGESTKKGSINYVLVFYNAMIIFARKHFSRQRADVFSLLIKMAVYFRAGLSIFKRFFLAILIPLLDFLAILGGYYIFTPLWESHKFPEGGHYPPEYLKIAVPIYIVIWLTSVYFTGGYTRKMKLGRLARGLTIGTVIILLIYSLLSEELRFSRALIIIGFFWAFISTLLIRTGIHFFKISDFKFEINKKKRLIIIGGKIEAKRIKNMLMQTDIKPEIIGRVAIKNQEDKNDANEIPLIGSVLQLKDIVKINKIDEIIFCSKDYPSEEIIKCMLNLSNEDVGFKIAPPESLSIIGSNSIHTSGELYVVNINSISSENNKRNKRILDFSMALILILVSPFVMFFMKKPVGFLRNCFRVLSAKQSWVGYAGENYKNTNLPKIRQGILNPLDTTTKANKSEGFLSKINMIYAKNYRITNDLYIIYKGFRNLGRV